WPGAEADPMLISASLGCASLGCGSMGCGSFSCQRPSVAAPQPEPKNATLMGAAAIRNVRQAGRARDRVHVMQTVLGAVGIALVKRRIHDTVAASRPPYER